MRYLLCGGGTGGHINPAIAIAKEIQSRDKDAVIEFGGSDRGMEGLLVPKAGFKLHKVEVYGFKRSLSPGNLKSLLKAVTSVWKASEIIKDFSPDIVIGTGGYASWPYIKAAAKLNIKTLLQEQNAYPGVTTKKLSRVADTVCVSYAESSGCFGEKVQKKLVLTGNPVTKPQITKKEARKKIGLKETDIYVLSCGGSLGADKVNSICLDAMEIYKDKKNISQIHATGKVGWEKYSRTASEKGLDKRKGFTIVEYIYDMELRQAAADIVISRAGAITSSELANAGKAVIFIPSPNVAEDHQYKNAAVMKNANAAEVFKESVIDGRILAKTVMDLAKDPEKRGEMEKQILTFAKPDAVKKIVDEVFKLLKIKDI